MELPLVKKATLMVMLIVRSKKPIGWFDVYLWIWFFVGGCYAVGLSLLEG